MDFLIDAHRLFKDFHGISIYFHVCFSVDFDLTAAQMTLILTPLPLRKAPRGEMSSGGASVDAHGRPTGLRSWRL